jgi:hypothetical protein
MDRVQWSRGAVSPVLHHHGHAIAAAVQQRLGSHWVLEVLGCWLDVRYMAHMDYMDLRLGSWIQGVVGHGGALLLQGRRAVGVGGPHQWVIAIALRKLRKYKISSSK